jgi:RHS repeat-associated protein
MTAAGGGARNLFKVDAGVVFALLQARYYDGSKGEFLSEDPVFLGDPKQQTLTDPQSLNSYSYADDNPITKSDPTGQAGASAILFQGGPLCVRERLVV